MVLFGTSLGVAGIAAGLHLQDERLLMGGAGIFAGMMLAGLESRVEGTLGENR